MQSSFVRPLNAYEQGIFDTAVHSAVRSMPVMQPLVALLRPFYHETMRANSGTDFAWRIYLSNKFFEPRMQLEDGSIVGLTDGQRTYEVLHQVLHNLYKHGYRAKGIPHAYSTVSVANTSMEVYKLVGDLEINSILAQNRSSFFYTLEDALQPRQFLLDDLLSMEEYYTKLVGKFTNGGSASSSTTEYDTMNRGVGSEDAKGSGSEEGSGGTARGTAMEDGGSSGTTQGTATETDYSLESDHPLPKPSCTSLPSDLGDSEGFSKPDPLDVQSGIDDFRSLAIEESRKQVGDGSINALIDRLSMVEGLSHNNFDEEFRSAVLDDMPIRKRGQHFQDYSRPRRKPLYGGAVIEPRRLRPGSVYYLILDVSASMLNEHDTKAVTIEINAVLESVKRAGGTVHVATGDTALAFVQENVTCVDEIQRYGGGGTDMVPLLQSAIDDYGADNLILISDMEVPVGGMSELVGSYPRKKFLFVSTTTMRAYPTGILRLAESVSNLRLLAFQ